MGAERERTQTFAKLEDGLRQAGDWYRWGPYVSERQWGTVREDYSADGEAWAYLPHDHARSRAYRWGEDGLAGFCDVEQRLCLGLALWNGRDPILKERALRPDGRRSQPWRGRQGVLVVPRRGAQPRLEPLALPLSAGRIPLRGTPTGERPPGKVRSRVRAPGYRAFDDDRYWIVDVHYAKADPGGRAYARAYHQRGAARRNAARAANCMVSQYLVMRDADSPRTETTHGTGHHGPTRAHRSIRSWVNYQMSAEQRPGGSRARAQLFCDNETNNQRSVRHGLRAPPWPKDGINDHVVGGAPTINPEHRGTKCAFWFQQTVAPGATVELRLRRRPTSTRPTYRIQTPSQPISKNVVTQRRARSRRVLRRAHPSHRVGR